MKKIVILAGFLACSILPSCNRQPEDYLTFTALSNGTNLYCFRTDEFKNNLPNISFSYDKNEWYNVTINNEKDSHTWTPFATLKQNEKVYLKGNNPTGFSRGEKEFIHFNALDKDENVIPFTSSGNIMSLIDSNNLGKAIPCDYCFTNMFGATDYLDCKLVKSPNLPATILKPHCYDHMFFDNNALEEASQLPSLKMEEKCYAYMFAQCVSLKSGLALRAKVTAPYCYDHMFYGNASIKYLEVHITDWDREGNFPCCFWVSFDGTYKMSQEGTFVCPKKLIPNKKDPNNFSETRVPYHWTIVTF